MTTQLSRIEGLLTENLTKIEARVTAVEIDNGKLGVTVASNCVEIMALRKANVVWSSVNSVLIIIGGIIMLVLRGS
jgi:hypothetical protein